MCEMSTFPVFLIISGALVFSKEEKTFLILFFFLRMIFTRRAVWLTCTATEVTGIGCLAPNFLAGAKKKKKPKRLLIPTAVSQSVVITVHAH